MKKYAADLVKSTVISIGMSLTIFCLIGVIFDIIYKGNFSMEGYRFTKMIVACIFTGLGFGVPTVVYHSENIPMPVKVLIHMGIGCTVYTIAGFAVGWIGGSAPAISVIGIGAIQLSVAFVIWAVFMRHYKKEAEELNERIRSGKNK